MDYYDSLTFDPDRGVWLDKDGYPVTQRDKPRVQPSGRKHTVEYEIDNLYVDHIYAGDAGTFDTDQHTVNVSLTTPKIITNTIDALTGSGPIQVIDPITVATSVTTPQISATTNQLLLKAVGATDRIKLSNGSNGVLEVQPGTAGIQIQATSTAADCDVTLIPKGLGLVSCSTGHLMRDTGTATQLFNGDVVTRVTFGNAVQNTFPASFWTILNNNEFRNDSGRTICILVSTTSRGLWGGSGGRVSSGLSKDLLTTSYYYGAVRVVNPGSGGSRSSIGTTTCLMLEPSESFSVWHRSDVDYTVGTAVAATLSDRSHVQIRVLP